MKNYGKFFGKRFAWGGWDFTGTHWYVPVSRFRRTRNQHYHLPKKAKAFKGPGDYPYITGVCPPSLHKKDWVRRG